MSVKHAKWIIIICISVCLSSTGKLCKGGALVPKPRPQPKPESPALEEVRQVVKKSLEDFIGLKAKERETRTKELQKRRAELQKNEAVQKILQQTNIDDAIRLTEQPGTTKEDLLKNLKELKATTEVLDRLQMYREKLKRRYEAVELPMSKAEAQELVETFRTFKEDIRNTIRSMIKKEVLINRENIFANLLSKKQKELESATSRKLKQEISRLKREIDTLQKTKMLTKSTSKEFEQDKTKILEFFNSIRSEVEKEVAQQPKVIEQFVTFFSSLQPGETALPQLTITTPIIRVQPGQPIEPPQSGGAIFVQKFDSLGYLDYSLQQIFKQFIADFQERTYLHQLLTKFSLEYTSDLLTSNPESKMNEIINTLNKEMSLLEQPYPRVGREFKEIQAEWQKLAALKDILQQRKELIKEAQEKITAVFKQIDETRYQSWQDAEKLFLSNLKFAQERGDIIGAFDYIKAAQTYNFTRPEYKTIKKVLQTLIEQRYAADELKFKFLSTVWKTMLTTYKISDFTDLSSRLDRISRDLNDIYEQLRQIDLQTATGEKYTELINQDILLKQKAKNLKKTANALMLIRTIYLESLRMQASIADYKKIKPSL